MELVFRIRNELESETYQISGSLVAGDDCAEASSGSGIEVGEETVVHHEGGINHFTGARPSTFHVLQQTL